MTRTKYLDNHRRARVAVIAFVLMMVIDLLLGAYYGVLLAKLGQLSVSDKLLAIEGLLDLAKLVMFVICAITFLAWFFRAFRNAYACGLGGVPSPGMAIVSWFVPFLNLVMPFQIAMAMWRQAGRERVGSAAVVGTWWACFLGRNISDYISTKLLTEGATVPAVRGGLMGLIASCTLSIFAALLVIRIIRKLTAAQDGLWLLAVAEDAFAENAADAEAEPAPVSTTPGERPVVGSVCAGCGDRIETQHDAYVCNACAIPLHEECLREGACPQCRDRDVDIGMRFY